MTVGTSSKRIGLWVYRSIMWRRTRTNGSPTRSRIPGTTREAATVSRTLSPGLMGARMGAVKP